MPLLNFKRYVIREKRERIREKEFTEKLRKNRKEPFHKEIKK